MADQKVSDLTAVAAVSGDELLYLVDDPSGTPLDRKVTATTLVSAIGALAAFEGKWPSGSYLHGLDSSTSTLALTADRLLYTPLWIPEARTTATIEVDMTVSGAGGTPTIRLGLYSPDANGRPGSLIVDAGTVDSSVAAGILSKALTQSMSRGLVWSAVVSQGATITQPTIRAWVPTSRFVNHTTIGAGAQRTGYLQASVTGALPATATPSTTSNQGVAPVVYLKAA